MFRGNIIYYQILKSKANLQYLFSEHKTIFCHCFPSAYFLIDVLFLFVGIAQFICTIISDYGILGTIAVIEKTLETNPARLDNQSLLSIPSFGLPNHSD
jgi:hypothetical protein